MRHLQLAHTKPRDVSAPPPPKRPRRWNPMEALASVQAVGVLVEYVEGDVESAWSPALQVVMVAAALSVVGRRCEIARLLAHRALGHWGRAPWQLEEARALSCSWLFTPAELRGALATHTTLDDVADELSITRELAGWAMHRARLCLPGPAVIPTQRSGEHFEDETGRVGRRVPGGHRMWVVDWTGTADWSDVAVGFGDGENGDPGRRGDSDGRQLPTLIGV